ncbi:N-(5'-phosphoribosyl)anthranilate isomerase [Haloprofundus marisrubri]|uniref:N-(5'-phosphoribosyl)anthranilate isomerase n=1 Tax=Haloprofundus marisrubri TaxID=1514971 RepID=A0A0W1R796_9EURY|nr:phosphoribosylanthranilate isomerase [Haloprofundus marisrubri]KTG09293.1 N-(5'-phosphoribosyl)anthranilate isomerase [Haloprofundus marisrubri]
MTRVKLCGFTRAADIRTAADAGVDAVGVITELPSHVDSPREVTPASAADLVAAAPPFVTTTLVLMPETPERAVELARLVGPDVLQLYGEFTADEFRYIRAETETKLLAAADAENAERVRDIDPVVDAVLLDSVTEDGAGGTGETHDWEATAELAKTLCSPVVLAGGLTPENVVEAIETVDPYGVDAASGVELTGGIKDEDAVRTFVHRAKATKFREEVSA